MKFYSALLRVPFLRSSYTLKFLFVAFLGIHIPLIAWIFFVSFGGFNTLSTSHIIIVTLLLTLVACAITLLGLSSLLKPIRIAEKALLDYKFGNGAIEFAIPPDDEVGKLLTGFENTIAKVEALAAEKADLITIISHDLRGPAARMHGLFAVINKELNTSETQKLVANGQEVSAALLHILDNMLTMLWQEESLINLERKELSVETLISKILKEIGSYIVAKQIQVIVSIEAGLLINVNEVLFSRVVENIIRNAIKYSMVGGTIHVEAKEFNRKTVIKIKDFGLGFDEQYKHKLFKRFSSIKRQGTMGEPTHGLGLYLSTQIMRYHNGAIEASSEGHGKGATFYITLFH